MQLLRCEVKEGPRPGFKTVGIPSIEGFNEYLTIEEKFLANRGGELLLPVVVIGKDRQHDTALVSLPDEADSGARRVWVHRKSIVGELDEVPA